MTTRFRSLLVVLIPLVCLLPTAFAASAQDPTSPEGLDIADLEGVKSAVSRSYALPISELVEAATRATPVNVTQEGPLLMSLLVAEFDTPEHAADGLTTLRDRLMTEMAPDEGDTELEATAQDDLGDAAFQIVGSRESGEIIGGYIVQDGPFLYLAIVLSEDNTSDDAARELVDFAVSHRPGSDEVIYDHTGTSRGGIWAKLPGGKDASALSGTQPIFDNQLLPAPEQEPEA